MRRKLPEMAAESPASGARCVRGLLCYDIILHKISLQDNDGYTLGKSSFQPTQDIGAMLTLNPPPDVPANSLPRTATALYGERLLPAGSLVQSLFSIIYIKIAPYTVVTPERGRRLFEDKSAAPTFGRLQELKNHPDITRRIHPFNHQYLAA